MSEFKKGDKVFVKSGNGSKGYEEIKRVGARRLYLVNDGLYVDRLNMDLCFSHTPGYAVGQAWETEQEFNEEQALKLEIQKLASAARRLFESGRVAELSIDDVRYTRELIEDWLT